MTSRMRLSAALALMVSPVLMFLTSPAAQARPAASSLTSQVAAAFRGSTAAHVDYRIHIANGGTIARNANRASAPASNQKLFTSITLLQLVGPDFRYATRVFGSTAIGPNGTLLGDLILVGAGDPTLSTADLSIMAKHLRDKGLRHVRGRLIVDDTRYSHVTRVAGWKHSFDPVESGTMDAFSVNGNEWRGGKSFIADPTFDNAGLFRKALKHAHISVRGGTRIESAPTSKRWLVTHHSASLASIVANTLTNSVNFNAEMMLREAGAQQSGHGSPASGIAAERGVASELDLPLGTVHDGSGLSYTDRETPTTIDKWLTKLKTLPIFRTVYDALPISCRTGTLEFRMCGRNVFDRVHAKTGSIDHVAALSGYTTTNSGQAVTFSFLLSGFKDRNFTRVLNHLDAAVAVIVRRG
jgi:serine-type D-Ala-D-Ala carboxypeptidase/endopeptidase (penicillin-binding protein 4)